ncbi:DUF1343 domain-containing protein [Pseudoalteromonas phenolica]|uniref:DUF1343 domain-containing protein n=1 Tax=Pseudoalteromonas phenolica TaxID=161398 RepID=A0A4Q7IMZ3_9GAMM|nr:DUF1343 domain-containing protein [Pseudoalteromonas phenolica]RZQ53574.1 DUF1343 domain-containing protein [Pseudoalteromonas phenolica]
MKAKLLLIFILLFSPLLKALEVGAEQVQTYLPLIKDKRVALVLNQSAQVKEQHLLDVLLEKRIDVKKVFSPEHGFRGKQDAGAKINDQIDGKTGLPIISLYGKSKKPKLTDLADVDVIIFDIQDVGVRFYTYISTMHYVLEAAAEAGKKVIVLDRPNPNINLIDGPVLEPEFQSFVGMHPIPVLHGMTVGELAMMIVGEKWLGTDKKPNLTVISVADYDLSKPFDLPIKPSPNLPNRQSIALYPSLCFFEATPISVGRGTDFPFQVFGHNKVKLGEFQFTPNSTLGAALNPKLKGENVFGQDLRAYPNQGFDLTWFVDAYDAFKAESIEFFKHPKFMDKLAGTDKLRKAIVAGKSLAEIELSWQPALEQFKARRQPYLIYQR